VQPEALLHHSPEVAQLFKVVLGDVPGAVDGCPYFVLELVHFRWVVHELRHDPFQSGVHRVGGSGEHILCNHGAAGKVTSRDLLPQFFNAAHFNCFK
jgi:hypothetical protein